MVKNKPMNKKNIPLSAAKKIADLYGQSQVIIVTWDKVNKRQHVVTYGSSPSDSDDAAIGGDFIKKALGWPDKLSKVEGNNENNT